MSDARKLAEFSEDELWAELERRRAALHVGFCYPAMCSEEGASDLVRAFGYEYGPWQFIELGHKLAEPPQWPLYTRTPDVEWARRTGVDQ